LPERRPSYSQGASSVLLIGETIGVHFDKAATRWGDCEALIVRHQDVRWSYAELKRRDRCFAAGLLALGLAPGDRIGIWSPNNSEWVVTQFASAKAGLILVNINPAYRLAELEYAINKVECKALITADRFKTSDYVGMLRQLAPEIDASTPGHLKSKKLPSLMILIHIGEDSDPNFFSFGAIYRCGGASEAAQLAELATRLQFDDSINIQFTSGTTGMPKGATLTHHNILNNGFFVAEAVIFGSDRSPKDSGRISMPPPQRLG